MSKTFQEEQGACGVVTHDEAERIAQAYIDHCFGNKENPACRVTHSIPADPRRDTALRLHAYIAQQRRAEAELDAIRAQTAGALHVNHGAACKACDGRGGSNGPFGDWFTCGTCKGKGTSDELGTVRI
jgi:DnaJ-class molecular chaperone